MSAYTAPTASTDQDNTDNDRTYVYDAIGNRLSATAQGSDLTAYHPGNEPTFGANPLNQYGYIQFPGDDNSIEPDHDADGNMTHGPGPGAQGLAPGVPIPSAANLKWDAENRLIEVAIGEAIVLYQYDHLGRLIRRDDGTNVTQYLYHGWNRITEYSVTVPDEEEVYTLTRTYLWGLDLSGTLQGAGGVGGLLSVFDAAQATCYYPAYDGNGNVSDYLDISGAIIAHFEYDPFGNLTVDSAENAASFPFRFSTKPQDLFTGLYYYGYRFYDPLTGRWPSRDPIEEKGGYNLYGFVNNSPNTNVDPDGREVHPSLPFPQTQNLRINVKEAGRLNPPGKCGSWGLIFAFRLSAPAPCDGYLVQRIQRFSWVDRDCKGKTAYDSDYFYEAWEIEENSVVPSRRIWEPVYKEWRDVDYEDINSSSPPGERYDTWLGGKTRPCKGFEHFDFELRFFC